MSFARAGRSLNNGWHTRLRLAFTREGAQLLNEEQVRREPPPLAEDDENVMEWGREADFADNDGFGFQVQDPKNDDPNKPKDPNNPKDTIIDYTEEGRKWEEVRVKNPNDDQQYVDVARVTEITFTRSTDGVKIRLIFNPPSGYPPAPQA